ncbi:MAG: hypothetical protein GXY47_03965 [Acidobacteria bacterium]|nr:hypothetical protein [Acidobacteriota bacterium]
MKTSVLSGAVLLFSAVLISAGGTAPVAGQEAPDTTAERRVTVLNPAIATKLVERVPLAPRTPSLEGKTLYLVDLQWGGPEAAYSVFEEMRDWFARNIPSVKIEIRRSAGGPFGDDAGLRKEILASGAAGAVIGIGG